MISGFAFYSNWNISLAKYNSEYMVFSGFIKIAAQNNNNSNNPPMDPSMFKILSYDLIYVTSLSSNRKTMSIKLLVWIFSKYSTCLLNYKAVWTVVVPK